jgi:RimJ/RimL family protein N-acetyltransferase
MSRRIAPEDRFVGDLVMLRLVTLADCCEQYVEWLQDSEVNRYLETRWSSQTLESVSAFVDAMTSSSDSYLFAIVDRSRERHVGNIKIGPVNLHHAFADISYFIGDRTCWGKGLATDAIRIATRVAFERLDLHKTQAALYAGNVGSGRALEKAGYSLEGRQRAQVRSGETWEDRLWYGLVRAAGNR